MLAQNFKTPADLKITDAEFDALRKVLGMLERGEIKSAPRGAAFDLLDAPDKHQTPTMFRMAGVMGHAECGTACCILGWAQHVNSRVFGGITWTPAHPCHSLFFPSNDGILSRDPKKGAIALRNYLTHGEPRWAEALAER